MEGGKMERHPPSPTTIFRRVEGSGAGAETFLSFIFSVYPSGSQSRLSSSSTERKGEDDESTFWRLCGGSASSVATPSPSAKPFSKTAYYSEKVSAASGMRRGKRNLTGFEILASRRQTLLVRQQFPLHTLLDVAREYERDVSGSGSGCDLLKSFDERSRRVGSLRERRRGNVGRQRDYTAKNDRVLERWKSGRVQRRRRGDRREKKTHLPLNIAIPQEGIDLAKLFETPVGRDFRVVGRCPESCGFPCSARVSAVALGRRKNVDLQKGEEISLNTGERS
jgi:hypothetical protein